MNKFASRTTLGTGADVSEADAGPQGISLTAGCQLLMLGQSGSETNGPQNLFSLLEIRCDMGRAEAVKRDIKRHRKGRDRMP